MLSIDRRRLVQGAALATLVAVRPAQAAGDSLIHVIAEIVAKPDKADEVRALLVSFVDQARKEPGCKSYALLEVATEPGRFMTSEVWADKASIDAHMTTPSIKELGLKLTPLLAKPFTILMLKGVSTS